jgi:hypothetical protein
MEDCFQYLLKKRATHRHRLSPQKISPVQKNEAFPCLANLDITVVMPANSVPDAW